MIKKIAGYIAMLLISAVIVVTAFACYLYFSAYSPEKTEAVNDIKNGVAQNSLNSTVRLLSFNTGYGSLSQNHDFNDLRADSTKEVIANTAAISEIVRLSGADIIALQEVDINSKRSYFLNQREIYGEVLPYSTAFCYKSRAEFNLKYLGKLNTGLFVAAKAEILNAQRISVSENNSLFKKINGEQNGVLVTNFKVEGFEKELSLINANIKKEEVDTLIKMANEQEIMGRAVIMCVSIKGEKKEVEKSFEDSGYKVSSDGADTERSLLKPYVKGENKTFISDFFVYSKNINLSHIETVDGEFRFSNHNPIIAEFKFE